MGYLCWMSSTMHLSTAFVFACLLSPVAAWPFTGTYFLPQNLTNIPEGSEHNVAIYACFNATDTLQSPTYVNMSASLEQSDTAVIVESQGGTTLQSILQGRGTVRSVCKGNDVEYIGNVTIRANKLGYNTLLTRLTLPDDSTVFESKFSITIVRALRPVDTVFNILLVLFIGLNQIGFGSKFDIDVANEVFKRPIPFVIWFFCQFLVMPLLAFAIGKALQLPPALAFGLFAVGASPGGGQSNIWTLLAGGDLTLSVCLTCASSFLSLGLMPFWLLTLGKVIFSDTINIPFDMIFLTLLLIVIPLSIGLLIRRKAPRVSFYVEKTVRPMALLFIIFLLTMGVYSNWYALRYMAGNYKILVSGLLLPWTGTLLSGVIALICRQPKYRAATIAIETASQNAAIAMVVLRNSFNQPEADLTIIMPVTIVIFTPIPFIIMALVRVILYCCTKKDAEKNSILDKKDETIESKEGVENVSHAQKLNGETSKVIESSKEQGPTPPLQISRI